MTIDFFKGAGRSSANPFTETLTKDLHAVDFFGRDFIVPAGSEVKHFETTNKGWIVWYFEGKMHLRDIA